MKVKDISFADLFAKTFPQLMGHAWIYLLISVVNASKAADGDCSLAMIRFMLLGALPVSVSSSLMTWDLFAPNEIEGAKWKWQSSH